jgi:hypothetical protein
MIPRHRIFHIALFLLIFLKFIGSSFEENVKYEDIKKSITVNKISGYFDKDSKLKSLCVSDEHFVDFILKRAFVGNNLHLSSSNLIPKSLIQISSRLLL